MSVPPYYAQAHTCGEQLLRRSSSDSPCGACNDYHGPSVSSSIVGSNNAKSAQLEHGQRSFWLAASTRNLS